MPRNFKGQFSDWPTQVIIIVGLVLLLAWINAN
ncbi:hypothetical protein SUDANB121_05872 (plasmid) [Nocardiopsis dassonvillei]